MPYKRSQNILVSQILSKKKLCQKEEEVKEVVENLALQLLSCK